MVETMKRITPLVLALFCTVLFVVPAGAADAKKPAAPAAKSKTPGLELATMASQITGIAISPMLGVSGVGAYQYFKASTPEEKAALPWFAQVSFWLPALLLVGVCAAKDTIAPLLPPGMKKPLDIAEALENTPREPAEALVHAGSPRIAAFLYGTLPGVLPQCVAYSLYRWEINIRMAAVLGFVGAGGLGQMLYVALSLFHEAQAASIILGIIVLVIIVDETSAVLRRWLASAQA